MAVVRKGTAIGLTVGTIEHVDQLPDDDGWLSAERAHHIDELNDAEPALAALVFGDERLGLGQALGDLRLSQMVALAEIPQQGTQLLLARRAQGVAHGGRPRSKAATPAHNPSFGLSHFGIMIGSSRRSAHSGRERDGGEGVR